MPSQLPGYLLRADDADLRRWKTAAETSGQSFAAYTREALDRHTARLVRSGKLPKWLAEPKRG